MIRRKLFLQWLILVGLIAVVSGTLWQHGLFDALFRHDKSSISLGITFIFLLTSAHAAYRVLVLSWEIDASRDVAAALGEDPYARLTLDHSGRLAVDATTCLDCVLSRHIGNLLRGRQTGSGDGHQLLLQALETRIRGDQEIGWLIADLMFKIGLLGTVIGFIIMLGGVDDVSIGDAAQMRAQLVSMSDGMRIALFTTLSGLVGGILLTMQYHLVERGADELLATVTEVVEQQVRHRLAAD